MAVPLEANHDDQGTSARKPIHNAGSKRVIVVDDDPSVAELFKFALKRKGYLADSANTMGQLIEKLKAHTYDAVLLDLYLAEGKSSDAVPDLVRKYPYTKVIMMSGKGTVEVVADAMEHGASTFVSKDKEPGAIVNELDKRLRPVIAADRQVTSAPNYGIVGQHPAIRKVLEQIERIKDVDCIVLIEGESGTGKELVSRAIHMSSKLSNQPFAAVNCAAIPENLLESELFGHKRGAFTDAKVDRKGIFEQVSNGTLLLDEIGEMPIELQAKLLRVLQEKEVTPLGASRPVKVNTRVIAATNRNLLQRVKEKRFREDLYYRLSVLSIQLPALRERRSDIPIITRYLIDKLCEHHGRKIAYPDPELDARLRHYDWPGNIRELQNAVERGIILSCNGHLAYEDMLPPGVQPTGVNEVCKGDTLSLDKEILMKPLSDAKLEFERLYLQNVLEVTSGNIAEVGRISKRYRADIYRLMSKHGLDREEFRHRSGD